jgi:hypothetical protein
MTCPDCPGPPHAEYCPLSCVSGEINVSTVREVTGSADAPKTPDRKSGAKPHEPSSFSVEDALDELRTAPFHRSPAYGVLLEWDMSDLGGEA